MTTHIDEARPMAMANNITQNNGRLEPPKPSPNLRLLAAEVMAKLRTPVQK